MKQKKIDIIEFAIQLKGITQFKKIIFNKGFNQLKTIDQ